MARANLQEIVYQFSANTLAHLNIEEVVIGNEFDFNKQMDTRYPACLIEFPVDGSIVGGLKTYNMAFQVIDMIELDQNDTITIASKVESIAHDVYYMNQQNFHTSGYTMPEDYSFLVTVENYSDYANIARVEFSLQVPRDDMCDTKSIYNL